MACLLSKSAFFFFLLAILLKDLIIVQYMIEGEKSSFEKVPLPSDSTLTSPPCPPPGEGARCVGSSRCGESSPSKGRWKIGKGKSGFAPADAEARAPGPPVLTEVPCLSPSVPARWAFARLAPQPGWRAGAGRSGERFALERGREGWFIKAHFVMRGAGEEGELGFIAAEDLAAR